VTLTVTIRNGTAAKVPVLYQVTLQNMGNQPCLPPSRQLAPNRAPLTLGPCGQLATVVRNASHVNVYPGNAPAYSCPLSVASDLAAHGTLSATAGWAGYEYLAGPGGTRRFVRAPAGNYHLVVYGKVAVPFKLVPGLARP